MYFMLSTTGMTKLETLDEFEAKVNNMTHDEYILLRRQFTYNVKNWDDCLELPYEVKIMLDELTRVRIVHENVNRFKERI